ncbi:hypothetical protein B0H14DRAFT_2436269 [Mycena olivaceomarginata]|nr:hypothetical protein B0H14DRAFT_2436269 [Mycena olivaceomarginata]
MTPTAIWDCRSAVAQVQYSARLTRFPCRSLTSRKADDLWLSSTDVVIIRAETRIFCIFASILKAYSSVLFSPPRPSESADMGTMEGHPVIMLHDKPEDVEVFCRPYLTPAFSCPRRQRSSSKILL